MKILGLTDLISFRFVIAIYLFFLTNPLQLEANLGTK